MKPNAHTPNVCNKHNTQIIDYSKRKKKIQIVLGEKQIFRFFPNEFTINWKKNAQSIVYSKVSLLSPLFQIYFFRTAEKV